MFVFLILIILYHSHASANRIYIYTNYSSLILYLFYILDLLTIEYISFLFSSCINFVFVFVHTPQAVGKRGRSFYVLAVGKRGGFEMWEINPMLKPIKTGSKYTKKKNLVSFFAKISDSLRKDYTEPSNMKLPWIWTELIPLSDRNRRQKIWMWELNTNHPAQANRKGYKFLKLLKKKNILLSLLKKKSNSFRKQNWIVEDKAPPAPCSLCF